MKVRMNRSVAVAGAAYSRGQEVEIPDSIVGAWDAIGHVTVLDPDPRTEAEEIEVPVPSAEELAAESVESFATVVESSAEVEQEDEDAEALQAAADQEDAAEPETEADDDEEPADVEQEETEEEAAAEPESEVTVGYAYDEMSLAELKAAAKEQDLATSGSKAVLIERLRGE